MIDRDNKKILKEDSQFGNYLSSDELGEYFVGPIMDVFKVAKIALKDIGKGVLYNLRIAFTFSTNKKTRLLKAYQQSKDKIDQEYGQIMPRIDKNLSEAKTLFFAANPVGFLAFHSVKSGLGTAKFMADTFIEQNKAMKGDGPTGPTKPEDGPILGALGDLKKIFFGESYIVGAILEAAEDGNESVDVEAEVRSEMEKRDIDPEKIMSDFKEWTETKKEIISTVNQEGLPDRMQALMDMMKAEELDPLKKAVAAGKSAGVDLGSYISDFEKEFEEQKAQLLRALEAEKSEKEGPEGEGNKDAQPGEEASEQPGEESTDQTDQGEEDEDRKKQESLSRGNLLEADDKEILSKVKEIPDIKKLGDNAKEEDYVGALEGTLFMTLKANLQEDGEKILGEIRDEIGEIVQVVTGPFADETEINEFSKASPEASQISTEILNCFKQLTGK